MWRYLPFLFPLLRMTFGFTSEGVVISLSVVVDEFLHLVSAVTDGFSFSFRFMGFGCILAFYRSLLPSLSPLLRTGLSFDVRTLQMGKALGFRRIVIWFPV